MATETCVGPVLVVEDDAGLRSAMLAFLAAMGVRAVGAADGDEALTIARAERPRLIILDLAMPNMDGWQFRARQRRDPMLASVPLIVVTAAGWAAHEARKLGAAAGFDKPVDPDLLRQVVERYCP